MNIYKDGKRAEIIRAYFNGKLAVFERLLDGRWYEWKTAQTISEEAMLMMEPERYEVELWNKQLQ